MQPEPSRLPERIRTALRELVRTFQTHDVRYALIGGLASGFRGRPRFTEDVDVLVRVPQLKLPDVLEELQSRGFDVDVIETVRAWNEHHLAQIHYQGVAIDWLKPLLPCLDHALDRAPVEAWADDDVRIVAAEDLILLKVLAMRPQDAFDIQNLLAANAGLLDLELIRSELSDTLPASDERALQFERLAAMYYVEGTDTRS